MAPLQLDSALRHVARTALAEFGVAPSRLTYLANRHNDVFRVNAESGERFVLRIQNDLMTDAQARSQLEWLATLAEQSGVTVPAPLRTSDSRAFTYVEVRNTRRRAVLVRWIPGRIARTRTEAVDRAAAGMIARMHLHTETFRQPPGFSCRRLDGDWLFGAQFFARAANADQHLTPFHHKIAATAEQFVRDAMTTLGHGKRRFGVIHADLNLDNIIWFRGRPSPIDFDEFGKSWYLFDLAELFRNSISADNWRQRKQLAISAYTEVRKLDETELEAFDAFIVAAFVQYLNWAFIHARSNDDLKWVGYCMNVVQQVTHR